MENLYFLQRKGHIETALLRTGWSEAIGCVCVVVSHGTELCRSCVGVPISHSRNMRIV